VSKAYIKTNKLDIYHLPNQQENDKTFRRCLGIIQVWV